MRRRLSLAPCMPPRTMIGAPSQARPAPAAPRQRPTGPHRAGAIRCPAASALRSGSRRWVLPTTCRPWCMTARGRTIALVCGGCSSGPAMTPWPCSMAGYRLGRGAPAPARAGPGRGRGPRGARAAPAPLRADFRLAAPLRQLRTAAEVLARLQTPDQTVVDARAAPRYRGEVEPLDPVAGHIPGALNRPCNLNMAADGRFKPAAELHAEFATLLAGRDPASVAHQCGSGVRALPNLLAMEIAGLGQTALFAGSWSEGCSDATRPVERGAA